MALPESSLSSVCSSIGSFVSGAIDATAHNIEVRTGPPADAASATSNRHRVNLFFYRFEPSGFDSLTHPHDPWRIRVFCLITAFGIDEDSISAGENDLRLLGEVMRAFHETPIQSAIDVNGVPVRLQALFTPTTDEQLNQIWSTQGEAGYRPSVIYELALVPVVPIERRVEPPIVGALGTQVEGRMEDRFAAFSSEVERPEVSAVTVNTENPAWTPAIAWVHSGELAYTLSFDVESGEFTAFGPAVWIAGEPGSPVQLEWEIWDSDGWRGSDPPIPAVPFSASLDPESIPAPVPGTFPIELALPLTLDPNEDAGQALLYATREYVPVAGAAPTTLRSNPLLISLYRSGP